MDFDQRYESLKAAGKAFADLCGVACTCDPLPNEINVPTVGMRTQTTFLPLAGERREAFVKFVAASDCFTIHAIGDHLKILAGVSQK